MSSLQLVGDVIELELADFEAQVLVDLVGAVCETLSDEPGVDEVTPDPAVLARLMPEGHRSDPELAAEYRALTEASVRSEKRGAAQRVFVDLPVAGGTARIVAEDTDIWLRVLTDVRLLLGVELDIAPDSRPPRRVRTRREARLSIYFWLTAMQDRFVELAVGRGART